MTTDILTTIHGMEVGLSYQRDFVLKRGVIRARSGAPIVFPDGVAGDLSEFNVKRYGAVGDGASVTADTDAFADAYAAAAPYKAPVLIPRGHYLIGTNIPLTGADQGVTWIAASLNDNLDEPTETGGVIVELDDATNDSLFTVAAECAPIHFRYIYFRGNQANQSSGTSRAVVFSDAVAAARSGTFAHCRFERWRSGAVSAGTFRDAGKMFDCQIRTCGFDSSGNPVGGTGADGLLLGSCNDWRLDWLDTGGHTRNGLYCTGAGTLLVSDSNFFANTKYGVRIDGTAQGIDIRDGSVDRNREDGIVITGSTDADPFVRRISGVSFSQNGQLTDDTYADIRIVNDPDGFTIIDTPFFRPGHANLPKYSIQTSGTTDGVIVTRRRFKTGAGAPYATAFTNDLSKLVIDGNVSFGSGAPTDAARQGSLYLRTDGSSSSTRAYINSDGGTTWVAVTTAS